MVAMFLLTLLAGTFDLGTGWRDSLAVNEAARAGARVGSGMGSDVNADRQLLTSARSALESSGLIDSVTRVVIFKAPSSGKMPSACRTGVASGCNVLTGAQFRAISPTSQINASGCITNSSSQWCPTSRINLQVNADYIGVWIQLDVTKTFGLLGKTQRVERTAVMRIEPV